MKVGNVKASGTVRILDKDGNVKSEFQVESIEIGDGIADSLPEPLVDGANIEEKDDAA